MWWKEQCREFIKLGLEPSCIVRSHVSAWWRLCRVCSISVVISRVFAISSTDCCIVTLHLIWQQKTLQNKWHIAREKTPARGRKLHRKGRMLLHYLADTIQSYNWFFFQNDLFHFIFSIGSWACIYTATGRAFDVITVSDGCRRVCWIFPYKSNICCCHLWRYLWPWSRRQRGWSSCFWVGLPARTLMTAEFTSPIRSSRTRGTISTESFAWKVSTVLLLESRLSKKS